MKISKKGELLMCGNCGYFGSDGDLSFFGTCQLTTECVTKCGYCGDWEPFSQKSN